MRLQTVPGAGAQAYRLSLVEIQPWHVAECLRRPPYAAYLSSWRRPELTVWPQLTRFGREGSENVNGNPELCANMFCVLSTRIAPAR